jgi:hypothetical protein
VTRRYGTFAAEGAINDTDNVTAARTPDGKLVIAYIPDQRTITIDLRKLSGRVWARCTTRHTGQRLPYRVLRSSIVTRSSSDLPA